MAVLIALVRRRRRAVGAAVRRAVDDEVPGAVLSNETSRVKPNFNKKKTKAAGNYRGL